jgi:hypothetical protein
MKQLSFANGNITEDEIKQRNDNYKFSNVTPKILSYPIRKCKHNKEGCIFAGEKNVCLLTNLIEEGCPKK